MDKFNTNITSLQFNDNINNIENISDNQTFATGCMLGSQPNHDWQFCFPLQFYAGGPDALAVVRPTGIYLLHLFCFRIQFYVLLCPYLCFISFVYLDLYVLGDETLISLGSFMKTEHLCVLIHILTKGKVGAIKYFTECSKAVLLLWIICVIYVLCLSCFFVCCLQPSHLLGKR